MFRKLSRQTVIEPFVDLGLIDDMFDQIFRSFIIWRFITRHRLQILQEEPVCSTCLAAAAVTFQAEFLLVVSAVAPKFQFQQAELTLMFPLALAVHSIPSD